MKKTIIIGITVIFVIISLVLYFNNSKQELGTTWTGEAINSATTTTSALPVMVLDANPARESAIIVNDSDTVVYLHLGYFASADTASTTVLVNQGIRLTASGGSYEINADNKYKNQVWATSTVASKVITYTEF